MQFSLRVICSHSIIEIVQQRVAVLLDYLYLSNDYSFFPYWKDDECAILELGAKIENPDYGKIQQYIQLISGTESISQSSSSDGWECAYFASLDELHSNTDAVFVVCNIF